MGISAVQFWTMTPRELKPYQEAQKMRREIADEEAWILGAYVHNACAVAFSNVMSAAFSKHSAGPQAKYLEHPFSWRPPELTEEEKIERTETLFKALGSLKDAFEANHPKLDDNSAVG